MSSGDTFTVSIQAFCTRLELLPNVWRIHIAVAPPYPLHPPDIIHVINVPGPSLLFHVILSMHKSDMSGNEASYATNNSILAISVWSSLLRGEEFLQRAFLLSPPPPPPPHVVPICLCLWYCILRPLGKTPEGGHIWFAHTCSGSSCTREMMSLVCGHVMDMCKLHPGVVSLATRLC